MHAKGFTGLSALVAACLMVAVAAPAPAQSLADVAKKEQERRKQTPPAKKVYTNKDLGAAPPSSAPAAGSGTPDASKPAAKEGEKSAADAAAPGTDAAGSGAGAPKEPKEPKDQKWWAARMKAAQDAVERDQTLAAAMQARISALTTDFVNRDDPAQRNVIERDRQRAMAELDRLKKQIIVDKQTIADIEEEARRAGVPPGWLR